jgi:hypothetical protein
MEHKVHPAVAVLAAGVTFAATLDLLGGLVNFDPVVLADHYGARTIQLRPGQVLRKTFHPPVDPNTITLSSDVLRWSSSSDPYASHAPIDQAEFQAVHPGLGTISIGGAPSWQFGPIYQIYYVLVRDRARPYDLALSQTDFGSNPWDSSGFALRVGDDVVVAYPNGEEVLSTNEEIVAPLWRLAVGQTRRLTTFRALRAGTTQLGFRGPHDYWLPATVVVSDSGTRFDVMASERDGGRVLSMRVGQSLGVLLSDLPGYGPWSLGLEECAEPPWPCARPLPRLVDPVAIGNIKQGAFGFLAVNAGTYQIAFVAQPVACTGQSCIDATREIHLTLKIS